MKLCVELGHFKDTQKLQSYYLAGFDGTIYQF
jgi:hypothetical protein